MLIQIAYLKRIEAKEHVSYLERLKDESFDKNDLIQFAEIEKERILVSSFNQLKKKYSKEFFDKLYDICNFKFLEFIIDEKKLQYILKSKLLSSIFLIKYNNINKTEALYKNFFKKNNEKMLNSISIDSVSET